MSTRWLACGILASALTIGVAGRPVRGADPVDGDLRGLILGKIQAGEKRVVVPPGKYRVTPRDRQHLIFKGLEGVEIIADGVEMVCTETTRAVTITDCRDLTIRGLVIDYDPLPCTQGTIVSLSPDKKVHEIELFEGYPPGDTVQTFKYEIFRPDTRTLRCPDYAYRVEKVDARHIRVIKDRGRHADPEQVGDLIVIGAEHAPGGSIPHAIETTGSRNVRLSNITLYGSNCFGFLETECDGTTYDHCRVDRRPASDDPAHASSARLRSLNADAFHSKFAAKGPTLTGCVAKFMGDDGVNICGNYHMITAATGSTVRVLAKDRLDVAPGTLVELVAYDGTRLPNATVKAVKPDGTIHDDERAFLLKQPMDQGLRTRWQPKAFRVTLDRVVDLPRGSLLASTRAMGNGFLVEGCDFGFNRSRGILIKASQGQVRNNTLTETWGEAIKVSPEYWWLESGSSNDVQIVGNTVLRCQTTAIAVSAQGGLGQIAPTGAHNRIMILENSVTDSPMPNFLVTSTTDLNFSRNHCTQPFRPLRAPNPIGGDPADLRAIMTTNCTQIRATGNHPHFQTAGP